MHTLLHNPMQEHLTAQFAHLYCALQALDASLVLLLRPELAQHHAKRVSETEAPAAIHKLERTLS